MTLTDSITFIVAVADKRVLEQNLLKSPLLQGDHPHQILIQEGFVSATRAYNDGIKRAKNELLIFLHSDMFLPDTWLGQLNDALNRLEAHDPDWGVLGCWGVTKEREYRGHIYSTGWGVLGAACDHPQEVQTLDEIVLILRKSSGLSFDEDLPHFHFYGTDICLTAGQRGLHSYAMSSYCVHNTRQILRLPDEFYQCYSYIRRKWSHVLPIQTSCIRVSRFNSEMRWRKFGESYRRILKIEKKPCERMADPMCVLQD